MENKKRFDFHLHMDGDKKRKNTPENVIEILNKNNVKFASITEHNFFDEKNYNYETLSKNDKSIIFIPGVELDVLMEDSSTKQFVVNSNDKKFICSFFLKKKVDDKKTKISKFIDLINKAKKYTLLSVHFMKQENRSFQNILEVEKVFNRITSPYVVKVLDMPSKKRERETKNYVDGKYPTFAFSDIRDWNNYNDKALDLPNFQENITEFDQLLEAIKARKLNSPSEFFEYEHFNNNKKLELFNGLNIVFGEKGSGKTELLESFYESNKKDFQVFIKTSEPKAESLDSLWKNFNKVKILDLDKKKNIENIAINLNKVIEVDGIKKCKNNWKFNLIIENIKNKISKNLLDKTIDDNEYLKSDKEDLSKKNKEAYDNFQKIVEFIIKILEIMGKDNYNGSIKLENIKNIFDNAISDWKKSIKFNHYKFHEKIEKKLSKILKLSNNEKIGVNDSILKLLENIEEKYKFIQNFNSNLCEIKKIVLLESDVLEQKFSFGWELIKRKNEKTTKNDFSNINKPKKTNKINKLIDHIFSKFKIWDILEWNINELENFALKDIYNIIFKSQYGKNHEYIPSSGQFDMLKIGKHISKNNNLIIDDFCNTFDNKYVFENIVKQLNKYKGIILASTHNPIVSIIPYVWKYIYLKRDENEKYNVYESSNSIYGFFKINNKEIKVRTQILNTIEGTEKAFKLKEKKYDL